MHAIADICVIPITGSISVRQEIAWAHQILIDAGLRVHLHAYGTNVEGDLTAILDAVGKIHQRLHTAGTPRVHTTVKLGTRTDKVQTMQDKVDAVQQVLESHD